MTEGLFYEEPSQEDYEQALGILGAQAERQEQRGLTVICGAESGPWVCDLVPGHDGPHIGGASEEHGQQAGLTKKAALSRLASLGVPEMAAARAVEMAPDARGGAVMVNGIEVSFADGYGYAVTPPASRGVPPEAAPDHQDELYSWEALANRAGKLELTVAAIGRQVEQIMAHLGLATDEDGAPVEVLPPPRPVMPYVNGKRFACERCGATVFTRQGSLYACNGCGTGYEGSAE